MAFRAIVKQIEIKAAAVKVWEVLFTDGPYRIWAAEFSEGCYFEGSWDVGSKIRFIDTSRSGIFGTITESDEPNVLTITYDGAIESGLEVVDSPGALELKGAIECYVLTETAGGTRLDTSGDMPEQYFDEMTVSWDRALEKVKELAEQS